ncbi:MAG: hypothetical protein SF066_14355 [Thermoanaerobaculia bacterium]|nr:hypothetical protein [Thermoanaerobaculia bacterium]
MYLPSVAAEKRRAPKASAAHPASPVQRALDESPRVTAQQAVASRLAQRRSRGVVQRDGNGLAEPAAIAAYALPLSESFHKVGPGERVALLRDAIHGVLAKAGVPPVEIALLERGDSAHFDETTWTMSLLRSSVESTDPGVLAELVGTVYHEARHAEQFFRVAQQAAAGEDEVGLHRHKFPEPIRRAAVHSRAEFAGLGEATRKGAAEWAESLKNPEPVLATLTATGRDLAVRVDAYAGAMGSLMRTVGILRTNLAMGSFGGGVVTEARLALEQQRSEQARVQSALGIYRDALLAYRRLPHERDAHELGWTVEDTFRTGAPTGHYDPTYASRVPVADPIWAELARLDHSLDQLRDLLEALDKASKSGAATAAASADADEDDDDFDALEIEEPAEVRARRITDMVVRQDPTKSPHTVYAEVLEQLKKADQERAALSSGLTTRTGWERLALLGDALGQWQVNEPRYLSALSASVHRRTNF